MSDYVKKYYDNNVRNEWKRLEDPYGKIEFLSTMYIIKKYFPIKGKILDIGCGPGRYSIELLKNGFNVTLMDLSSKNLFFAKSKIESLGLCAENYICGDANYLNTEENDKYDCVLLMGPMYHIISRDSRINVLKQCRRILKNEGIILISYINFIGVLREGMNKPYAKFEDRKNIYKLLDVDSYYIDNKFNRICFTIPEVAIKEVIDSGFRIISYAGAESFLSGQWYQVIKYYLENRKIYMDLLEIATETCEDSKFRDNAEHLIVVANKVEV